jgi:hypothetical protein
VNEELAWAAGFVDGEGSVTIISRSSNGGPRRSYSLRLTVGQRVLTPLLRLQRLFGGHISTKPLPQSGCFVWTVHTGAAVDALAQMRPFLTVKGPQADVAAQFNEVLRTRGAPKRVPLSPAELEQRETLMLAMRAANHANGSQVHWRHRQTI